MCIGAIAKEAEATPTVITSPYSTPQDRIGVWNDGRIRTDSASGSACPSGSYVKTDTATTYQITLGASGGANSCARVYYEFNIDALPYDGTITQVNFTYTVSSISGTVGNCDFTGWTNEQQLGTSASNTWSDIANTVYVSNDAGCKTTGTKTITLGSQAITDITDRRDNTRTSFYNNWFNVGMKFNDETRSANLKGVTLFGSRDTTSSNRPYLTISFTDNTYKTVLIKSADTTEDGTVDTNSAIGLTCPTTSYSKTSTTSATAAEPRKPSSVSATQCGRAYWQFDKTSITGNHIQEIILQENFNTGSNSLVCDVALITVQPSTSTASQIWNAFSTVYSGSVSYCNTDSADGGTVTHDLSLSNGALSDFTNNNYFAIGAKLTNETRDLTTHTVNTVFSESTSALNTPPVLIVKYRFDKTFNDNLSLSESVTKSISKSFNEGMSIIGANIKSISKSFTDSIIVGICDIVNTWLYDDFEGTSYDIDFDGETTTNGKWVAEYLSGGDAVTATESGNDILVTTDNLIGLHAVKINSTIGFGSEIHSRWDARLDAQSTEDGGHGWYTHWFFFTDCDITTHYYFALKTNGWEVGKKDNDHDPSEELQEYLATGDTPFTIIGDWHTLEANVTHSFDSVLGRENNYVQVYVDGSVVWEGFDREDWQRDGTTGTGASSYMMSCDKHVAMYQEGSNVSWDNIFAENPTEVCENDNLLFEVDKTFNEDINIAEDLLTSLFNYMIFNENISISDNVISKEIDKTFSEIINIAEDLIGDFTGGEVEFPPQSIVGLALIPIAIVLLPIIMIRRRRRND